MGAGSRSFRRMRRAPPSSLNCRSPAGTERKSSSLAADRGMNGATENGDLPDHLRCHIENRPLPDTIGLGESPWGLAGEIPVGFGDNRPDRAENLMQLLRPHRSTRGRYHAVGQLRIASSAG